MDAERPLPPTETDLAPLAQEWVRRMRAGLALDERRALRAWLAANPAHAAAFSRADSERTPLDWPLHAGAMDEVIIEVRRRAVRRKKRRRTVAACAAAMVLLAVAGGAWSLRLPMAPAVPLANESTLLVHAPEVRMLPDGTRVHLADGAELAVDFSGVERLVHLARGKAHFEVNSDATRPFVVRATGVSVRAVGTAFEVELGPRTVSVMVSEGRVAVERSEPGTEPVLMLQRFDVAVVSADDLDASLPVARTMSEEETTARLAWRVPRLEFSGTPLAEVVAAVNRHNASQLIIADVSLLHLVVSGVIRADNITALIDLLEADFGIVAEQQLDRVVLRGRGTAVRTRPSALSVPQD